METETQSIFTTGQPQYPRQNENEINLALSEAWACSRRRDLSFRTWRMGSVDDSC